jgi:hypothetical protein
MAGGTLTLTKSSMPFEVLHFPLVPLRRRSRLESSEVAALAGASVLLS